MQEFSLHFLWLQEVIHKVKENKRKKKKGHTHTEAK